MNLVLWALQIVLALHTVMGALWKFSNSEQTVPSLKAIPHEMWLALGAFELLCALGLVFPAFYKPWAVLASIGAIGIAAEMLLFVGVHLSSGATQYGQMIYWLTVAAVCAFIVFGRLALKPV